ncbi:membrane protein [Fulvitalea axinellae]|uniref:Membrane protein n=1 Tax=Fulvitalea axinellae TaxID=1182444 RepID=A0AAU9CIJ3_9BACT|nr:membrane protein [Fulvitalea axinellae]
MMKKGILHTLALALVMSVSSCNDWLVLEPENDITVDDFWKSKEDIRSALNGGYQAVQSQVNTMFLWGDLRSDFVRPGSNDEDYSEPWRKVMRLEILDNNTVLDWSGMYKIINYANTVIKYAPSVRGNDLSLSQKELNGYLAEAYFQRSLAYFYLVRTFGEVPFHLEPTDSDGVDVFLAKSTEQTILDQLVQDLEWAERYAPRGFDELEFNKGYGTKAAVQALLADIHLWGENYEKSILYCNKIINRSTFSLVGERLPSMTPIEEELFDPAFEFRKMFTIGNTQEGIFEVQFNRNVNQHNSFWRLFGGSDGNKTHQPSVIISEQVPDLYDDNDFRRRTVLGLDEDNDEVLKFDDGNQRDVNWMVYRYADILLMKAEALVETGDFFGAQNLLNQVRNRAGLGPKIMNGERFAAQDMILQERALEFAFEGKRWFDLMRFAKRNNYERSDKLIDVMVSRVDPAEAPKWRSLLSDPQSYYLPIHRDELRSNENLKQNPYYE